MGNSTDARKHACIASLFPACDPPLMTLNAGTGRTKDLLPARLAMCCIKDNPYMNIELIWPLRRKTVIHLIESLRQTRRILKLTIQSLNKRRVIQKKCTHQVINHCCADYLKKSNYLVQRNFLHASTSFADSKRHCEYGICTKLKIERYSIYKD